MKMKIGQLQRLKNLADRGSDRIKLSEGENLHRILFGPIVVSTVFWPSLQRDDDGEVKSVTKSAKVPDRGSLFDGIAALDRKIQRATGVDKPKSQLDKSTKFNYLVIDVDKEPMRVSIAQYPKTVKDALIEIEEKRDTDDGTKLRYGLIWMYNVIISKDVDPTKERRYGTDYSAEPDPKNPWLGQVPADWLKADFNTLVEEGYIDLNEVFSSEMLQALEEADIDLEAEGIPDSEEIILERLAAFPIDLNGESFGKPSFIRPELMAAELRELELPFINQNAPTTPTPALLPSQAGKEEEIAAVVEEEFEVVDDLRITKNSALYKTNFTPPTAPVDAEVTEEVPAGLEEDFEVVDEPPSQTKTAKKLQNMQNDAVDAEVAEEVPVGLGEDEDEGEKPTKLRSLLASAKAKAGALTKE